MIEDMQLYMKNYYKNNKEKWKNKYNNTDKYKEYQKNYREEHKEDLSLKKKKYFKEFTEKNEGRFIYFIFNEANNLKYIGKSTNLFNRFYVHKHSKEKFNADIDRVLYLDFTKDKISKDELFQLEQYFIEIFKPKLNDNVAEYDTNIINIVDKKELIFNEFKFKSDNSIKPSEVYDIRDTLLKRLINSTKEEVDRMNREKLFTSDGVMFVSDVETVKRYINLDIEDEEYEIMANRVKDNYKDYDNAFNLPVRHILYSLRHYKEISLTDKGNAINYYYNLLKDYSDKELSKILDKEEMNLYKRIKERDYE